MEIYGLTIQFAHGKNNPIIKIPIIGAITAPVKAADI